MEEDSGDFRSDLSSVRKSLTHQLKNKYDLQKKLTEERLSKSEKKTINRKIKSIEKLIEMKNNELDEMSYNICEDKSSYDHLASSPNENKRKSRSSIYFNESLSDNDKHSCLTFLRKELMNERRILNGLNKLIETNISMGQDKENVKINGHLAACQQKVDNICALILFYESDKRSENDGTEELIVTSFARIQYGILEEKYLLNGYLSQIKDLHPRKNKKMLQEIKKLIENTHEKIELYSNILDINDVKLNDHMNHTINDLEKHIFDSEVTLNQSFIDGIPDFEKNKFIILVPITGTLEISINGCHSIFRKNSFDVNNSKISSPLVKASTVDLRKGKVHEDYKNIGLSMNILNNIERKVKRNSVYIMQTDVNSSHKIEKKKSSKQNNSDLIQLQILVDRILVFKSKWKLPAFCNWEYNFPVTLDRSKELEFNIYTKESSFVMAVGFLPLYKLVDGKEYTLSLSLLPLGSINCTIKFINQTMSHAAFKRNRPMIIGNNSKDIPRAKDLNTNIATWSKVYLSKFKQEIFFKGSKPTINKVSTIDIFENMTLSLDRYTFIKVLGRGHFGKVILAEDKYNHSVYALKCLKKKDLLILNDLETLIVEREVLKIATEKQCPFILKLFGMFKNKDYICYVLEFLSGGDLMTHIHLKIFGKSRAKFYGACVLCALIFLHQNNIMYRDLKLDNILLNDKGYVVLVDFGLCKMNMGPLTRTNTICGTPEFIAPEMLISKSYTRSIDWWGFGILMYEMISGEYPFDANNDEELFHAISNKEIMYSKKFDPESLKFLKQLLVKEPKDRLGYGENGGKQIKETEFFNEINFEQLQSLKITPSFIPKLKSKLDCKYFEDQDEQYNLELTPVIGDNYDFSAYEEYFDDFNYSTELTKN